MEQQWDEILKKNPTATTMQKLTLFAANAPFMSDETETMKNSFNALFKKFDEERTEETKPNEEKAIDRLFLAHLEHTFLNAIINDESKSNTDDSSDSISPPHPERWNLLMGPESDFAQQIKANDPKSRAIAEDAEKRASAIILDPNSPPKSQESPVASSPKNIEELFQHKLSFARTCTYLRERTTTTAPQIDTHRSEHPSYKLEQQEEELFILLLNSIDPRLLSGLALPDLNSWQLASDKQNSGKTSLHQDTKTHNEKYCFLYTSQQAFKQTLYNTFQSLDYKEVILSLIYIALIANLQLVYANFALSIAINYIAIKTKLYLLESDIEKVEKELKNTEILDEQTKLNVKLNALKTQSANLDRACSLESIFLYFVLHQISPFYPDFVKLATIIYYELRMFQDVSLMIMRTSRDINKKIKEFLLDLRANFNQIKQEKAIGGIMTSYPYVRTYVEQLMAAEGFISEQSKSSLPQAQLAEANKLTTTSTEPLPQQQVDAPVTLNDQAQKSSSSAPKVNPKSTDLPSTYSDKDIKEFINKKVSHIRQELKKQPDYQKIHKALNKIQKFFYSLKTQKGSAH